MPRGRLSNGKRGPTLPKRLSVAKKGNEVVQHEQDDGTGAESASSSERNEEDGEADSDTSASASPEESGEPATGGKTADDGCAGTASPKADGRESWGAGETDVFRGEGRGHVDVHVDRACGTPVDTDGDDVRISSRVLEQLIQAQDRSGKENTRLEALFLNAMAQHSGGSRKHKAWKVSGHVSISVHFACLALAADKSRRADLNETLSEWKTRAAARVRDIALPKLGLFRDDRDASSPWAPEKERSIEKIRERIGLGADPPEALVLTSWAHDRDGMLFASRAFATCPKAAFKPKKAGLVMTLKVYHLAWLEHVVSECVLYWEARKGRLSNLAGGNAHVVDGLKVLVKEDVERAIRIRNPEYDAEREAWIWGRHGLRISACGLEHMKPAAAAQSEGIVGDDDLSASEKCPPSLGQ
ncbi:unnamed protein product [Closterium sp. NIES-64]|nr:unnamed protein product [Closterium sp. NIES-64]